MDEMIEPIVIIVVVAIIVFRSFGDSDRSTEAKTTPWRSTHGS